MKEQDITDFETEIRKTCENYREKLNHASLVGVLDTVKMIYHVSSIQTFEEEQPRGESPAPVRRKK